MPSPQPIHPVLRVPEQLHRDQDGDVPAAPRRPELAADHARRRRRGPADRRDPPPLADLAAAVAAGPDHGQGARLPAQADGRLLLELQQRRRVHDVPYHFLSYFSLLKPAPL